jgi:hypothetical protein
MKKFLILLLIATSCAPTYIPNIRNSPMFTQKGEVQVNFQVGNGLNGQAAVSITNNIGIMGSYSYLRRTGREQNNAPAEDYRKHTFGEAGIGYFKNNNSMFVEIFAGYGEGTGLSNDNFYFFGSNNVSASGNYKRYFFQPAFGMNKRTMFVSFVPRFSVVEFTEFSNGGVRYVVEEDPILFFEPGVIGRVNFDDNFYFTFQTGLSLPVTAEPFYDHRGIQVATGIGVRFGGRKLGSRE